MLSKLLERLVAKQLLSHLDMHKLLPDLQAASRAHQSTETAMLKVLSDILTAVDNGDLAMLVMLDLSAAFESVEYADDKSPTDWMVPCSSGSRRIFITAHSLSAVPAPRLPPRVSTVGSHRGRSLDRSSSFCTRRT